MTPGRSTDDPSPGGRPTPLGDTPLGDGVHELHSYGEGQLPVGPLRLVTWNVGKPRSDEALDQILALSHDQEPELLVLQESTHLLRVPEHMGAHFVRNHRLSGVATAATARPEQAVARPSPERELGVTTRKMALVTHYTVEDGRDLQVINVHGLNFDRSGQRFIAQMRDLAEKVALHEGPLVFAGDFNTWSQARVRALAGIVRGLGLTEVVADSGSGRTGSVGRALNPLVGVDPSLHLDRVFVRGLRSVEAHWLESYDASDHVPLYAQLELED